MGFPLSIMADPNVPVELTVTLDGSPFPNVSGLVENMRTTTEFPYTTNSYGEATINVGSGFQVGDLFKFVSPGSAIIMYTSYVVSTVEWLSEGFDYKISLSSAPTNYFSYIGTAKSTNYAKDTSELDSADPNPLSFQTNFAIKMSYQHTLLNIQKIGDEDLVVGEQYQGTDSFKLVVHQMDFESWPDQTHKYLDTVPTPENTFNFVKGSSMSTDPNIWATISQSSLNKGPDWEAIDPPIGPPPKTYTYLIEYQVYYTFMVKVQYYGEWIDLVWGSDIPLFDDWQSLQVETTY